MSSSILINQLIVVGRRKNYTINFNKGVNIIYGDSATGKSSILNLIDYLLGSKVFDTYPEIESAGKYAVLDIDLNEVRYCIKRDIFDAKKPIEVYQCEFSDIDKHAVKKYSPTFNKSVIQKDLPIFSEFLITSLDLTNLMIKQSPSKDDSELVRLSFRDLMKFCYIDQDDLGSKKYFNSDNYSLQAKNQEVFKYIFNTLDNQISELAQDISTKTQLKNSTDTKLTTVSEFLRESEFGEAINFDNEISAIDLDTISLKEGISELNKKMVVDTEVQRAIQSTMDEIDLNKKTLKKDLYECERKIEQFSRLKNDYSTDIVKFNSSIEAMNSIGKIQEEVSICPICDNTLKVESAKERFKISSPDKISQELVSLKRRIKDSSSIINQSKSSWDTIKLQLSELEHQETESLKLIEKNTKELTSPYLVERDILVTKLGSLQEKRQSLVSKLKIRNQQNNLSITIRSLELSIDGLKVRLEKLEASTPSMSNLLSNLANSLSSYLKFVKIKDPTGIKINPTKFTPIVRETEYGKVTSGGLRTIICIGYLCSLMEEALTTTMSFPSFLMIDTVGKFLGKTKSQKQYIEETSNADDIREGVSDPLKYQNIFEYIIKLAKKYQEEERICQFILVDNDVPDHIIDQLSGFIVAHFSSERSDGLPVGFIDDATV